MPPAFTSLAFTDHLQRYLRMSISMLALPLDSCATPPTLSSTTIYATVVPFVKEEWVK